MKVQFDSVTDKELLQKVLYYLFTLRPNLPFSRLREHCSGAYASLFELLYFLDSHNISDYGDFKK